MLSLITGIVAVATTTALSAFSEGLITSVVAYAAVKGASKANVSIKK